MCHFEGEISERANWDFIAFWQKKIPVKKKDTKFLTVGLWREMKN